MDGGEPSVFPPELVFQRQTQHYIEVISTPIVAKMTAESISKVRRGFAQSINLQPAVHSVDPDFPDIKNFSITWKCRKMDETFPTGEAPSPVTPLGGGAGCFGNGIGLIDYKEREMLLFGSDFVGIGEYEIYALLRKDVRTDDTMIHLEVVAESVPIVQLE